MDSRRARALQFIEPSTQRGLEFGALDRPLVRRADGEIFYVDHLPSEGLRGKYRSVPGYNVDMIVNVDFVWNNENLSDIVGHAAPFDYVIASHVIEHVPDVIGWLNQVCDVLGAKGIISLVIPDKRFIFDLYRPVTSLADLVACYLEERRKPSVRQIFEAYSLHARVDCAELWRSSLGPKSVDFVHDELFALEICKEASEGDKYLDIHCSVFTPEVFYQLMEVLFKMKLIRCAIESMEPTQLNESEFFVSLRKE
jgi:hypothetical protein